MNDIQLAKLLGMVSLGRGAFEMAAGRELAQTLGLRDPELVQAFGAREVANGLIVLTHPDSALPMWGRVAGDALDLAVLASALGSRNRQRHNVAWAMIMAVGVTVLDVACAVALTRRAQRAHSTARRTRVQRMLPGDRPG